MPQDTTASVVASARNMLMGLDPDHFKEQASVNKAALRLILETFIAIGQPTLQSRLHEAVGKTVVGRIQQMTKAAERAKLDKDMMSG